MPWRRAVLLRHVEVVVDAELREGAAALRHERDARRTTLSGERPMMERHRD